MALWLFNEPYNGPTFSVRVRNEAVEKHQTTDLAPEGWGVPFEFSVSLPDTNSRKLN
jgi:hypothetical protein